MVLSSDNGGYVGSNDGGCNSSTGFGGADSTDYGHGTACFNGEAGANNWPLRGGKYSMFEGGIRVNAFASGGYLKAAAPNMIGTTIDGADGMIHIADWYATFAGLAGVDPKDAWAKASGLPAVDSVDVWPLLTGKTKVSPRDTILVNKNLLVHKQWKYVTPGQSMMEASWGGPHYPNASSLKNNDWVSTVSYKCSNETLGCLFNVVEDPTEQTDVGPENPDLLASLQQLAMQWAGTIYEANHGNDPNCKQFCEQHYGGFYGPYKELEQDLDLVPLTSTVTN